MKNWKFWHPLEYFVFMQLIFGKSLVAYSSLDIENSACVYIMQLLNTYFSTTLGNFHSQRKKILNNKRKLTTIFCKFLMKNF